MINRRKKIGVIFTKGEKLIGICMFRNIEKRKSVLYFGNLSKYNLKNRKKYECV